MNMRARHDQVRSCRGSRAEHLANLLDVVVEKADQVGRAQNHSVLGGLEREAANVKRIVDGGGDSVMTKSRQIDSSSGDIGRDHGLRRSRTDRRCPRDGEQKRKNMSGGHDGVSARHFYKTCASSVESIMV